MKKITAIILLLSPFIVSAQDQFFKQADALFKTHVNDRGLIDYEAIKSDPTQLNELLAYMSTADYESFDDATKKAFLINAYNVAVIKQVTDLLPLKSPLDNKGFFNGIKHQVAGKMMTLDELEKGLLYPTYPDARLHWVLVCAAMSCPPLATYAYFPDRLEEQLDARTREVLNLDWFVPVNGKKVQLSQIFSWYRGDFTKDGQSLIEYVNQYRDTKLEAKRPSFYEYDWSLNAQ
ncbi:MAG: DUF547 domain-containing protein [Bacteroidota bacterium]